MGKCSVLTCPHCHIGSVRNTQISVLLPYFTIFHQFPSFASITHYYYYYFYPQPLLLSHLFSWCISSISTRGLGTAGDAGVRAEVFGAAALPGTDLLRPGEVQDHGPRAWDDGGWAWSWVVFWWLSLNHGDNHGIVWDNHGIAWDSRNFISMMSKYWVVFNRFIHSHHGILWPIKRYDH